MNTNTLTVLSRSEVSSLYKKSQISQPKKSTSVSMAIYQK